MGSAILFSKVGAVASEFPGFVSELQILLVRDGVGVGSCEAVGELADRLQGGDSTLRGDLASAIGRLSVEGRQVTYLEVLGLLLAAAAGQKHADELAYAPALEEPVQELFRFVVEARGGGAGRSGGDLGGNGFARPSEEGMAESGLGEAGLSAAEQAGDLGSVGPELDGFGELHRADTAQRSVLARALAISADDEAFPPGSLGPWPADEVKGSVSREREIPLQEVMQRTRMYAVGVSGVLLGVLLGLLVGRRPVGREGMATVAETKQGDALAGTTGSGQAQPIAVVPGSGPLPATSVAESSKLSPTAEEARGGGVEGSALPSSRPPAAAAAGAERPDAGGGIPAVPAATRNAAADETHGSPLGAGRVLEPSVEVASAGIMAENLLASPVPAYPPGASAARVEGEVVVSAVVGRDGSVVEAKVVSGPPALCEAARKAVQAWRYRPYAMGGKPVEIITTARVDFRLNGR